MLLCALYDQINQPYHLAYIPEGQSSAVAPFPVISVEVPTDSGLVIITDGLRKMVASSPAITRESATEILDTVPGVEPVKTGTGSVSLLADDVVLITSL